MSRWRRSAGSRRAERRSTTCDAARYGDVATAFLLAVQSTAPPGENGSRSTWFDVATTRDKLAENRDPDHARELQRVIEMAEQQL